MKDIVLAHFDDNSVNTLIKILKQLKMDRTFIIMTNDLVQKSI